MRLNRNAMRGSNSKKTYFPRNIEALAYFSEIL